MHEMALAESVLGLLEESARREEFSAIRAVWLDIGCLAGVEVEALRFCFEVVTRDSIAAGARLEIVDSPGQGWCMKCSEVVPINSLFDACPRCGTHQVQVTAGTEMRVREMEVV
jgi:hydrogenase nickel incorporation protein HypA/HybF